MQWHIYLEFFAVTFIKIIILATYFLNVSLVFISRNVLKFKYIF